MFACAGLHNFLRKERHSDKFSVKSDIEGSSSSSLPINEGNDFEPIFETQEQQRENANQWRTAIATQMWNDVGNTDNYGQ